MKINLYSIVVYILKSLLTIKKILFIGSLLAIQYYAKKKFFNIKKSSQNSASIQPIANDLLSEKSQMDFVLILKTKYAIPDGLIQQILYKTECQKTRKNLIFLSFYEKNFINKKIKNKSNPSFFDYNKEIKIDNNLFAILHIENPFSKKSKDKIIIRNDIAVIQTGNNEHLFINQIYTQIIKEVSYLDEYNTLEECKAINNIFNAIHNCNTIAAIEKASKNLFIIKSVELQAMLLEQLQIKAYHFWCELKIDKTKKEVKAFKTDRILLHPHFFICTINPVLYEKKYLLIFRKKTSLFNTQELNNILTSKNRYHFEERILGEKTSVVCSESIGYPVPFIAIQKYSGPVKMN